MAKPYELDLGFQPFFKTQRQHRQAVLVPFASRITIWLRSKSKSHTRHRHHSETRIPVPYSSSTMSRWAPFSGMAASNRRTSSLESTVGNRVGFLARTASSDPMSFSNQRSQVLLQNVAIQEQNRPEGLVLRAGRNPAVAGQMRQKGLDIRFAHVPWVNPAAGPPAMEAQKLLHPPCVSLRGAPGRAVDFAGGFVLVQELHGASVPRKNCSVHSRGRIRRKTKPTRNLTRPSPPVL